MIRTILLFFAFASVTNAASNSKIIMSDLKKVCVHGNKFANGPTDPESYKKFATAGAKIKLKSPVVTEAWAAYLNAAPGSKYAFLVNAAKKASKTKWACPSLKMMDR